MFKKLIKIIKSIKHRIEEYIFKGQKGSLSWYLVFRIAFKNLISAKSRTLVTVLAIAVGTAVVVILVSFAYGLQSIVNKRLIQPNSLRLTDVQTSSTAVSLTHEKIKEIEKITNVEKLALAVSLAGSFSYKDMRLDTVVVGADNQFLNFSHTNLITGKFFSPEAEKKYLGKTDIEELLVKMEEGEVGGIYQQEEEIYLGKEITSQKIYFRLNEESYYPLREKPEIKSRILGFVYGSFLKKETGVEVFGGVYESVSTVGKFYQDKNGKWWGKWLKTTMPIFEEVNPGLYQPVKDENGSQKKVTGYLAEKDVKILSQEEMILERQMEKLMNKFSDQSSVLGTATSEGDLTALDLEKSSTQTAELKQIIETEKAKAKATPSAQLAMVEIKKKGGKEVLVSTGLLNVLKIKPEKILGEKISLSYIVSGNLIPKISGRVIAKSLDYKVIGVFKEDKKQMVIVPLADLESMGISRYSMGKVLVKNEESLANVRQKIESLGFMTLSIVDTLNQVNRLFQIMRFLLGTFGLIALIVAVLGMFNTLTVSLLERTREVAVMKTLGTIDSDVRRLFLAESVIIGISGGILGIFLGLFLGEQINLITSFFRDDKTVKLFSFPFGFLILVFFLSILIGVLTGLYPAKRAKDISPLNALRYE